MDLTVNNLDELKSKSPDAHALYTQYARNAGGGATAFGGNGNGNIAMGKANEMLVSQLEQMKAQFKDKPAMQRMIDEQIKAHKKR